MLHICSSLCNDSQVQKSVILASSYSLSLQTRGVNRALAGGEVKPPAGFLPWQKLGHRGKYSRQGNTDLGNQSRGNLGSDIIFLTALLHASMLCGLYGSSFELSEVLKM